MNSVWQPDLDAERDAWRAVLGLMGYSDDGETLRGPVSWSHPDGRRLTATIEVSLDSSFPFGPPKIDILDPGAAVELTFHREPTGHLCLWPPNTAVDSAPWRQPHQLITRVAEWLSETAAGWPGDGDCDLERYLTQDSRIVLYDIEKLATTSGCVRTTTQPGHCVYITSELQRPHGPWTGKSRRGQRPGRRDRHLAWIADIGVPRRPILDWATLKNALGDKAVYVDRLVRLGVIQFVIAKYQRAGNHGVLAIAVRPPTQGNADPSLTACESADTSMATRMLRAGSAARELTSVRVAIVGVGAIGSFIADQLFRSGIRILTLIDPQLLRPGNVIRHLAGDLAVGLPKSTAVKATLNGLGMDTSRIDDRRDLVDAPAQAIELLREHDLVIDATANNRVSSLLAWATGYIDNTPVVSVCVQREGAIVRVDRFPLRGGETHLRAISAGPQQVLGYERGCDDPVSTTAPGAVVAAAMLAAHVAIDELTYKQSLPASLVHTLVPQEEPFHLLGIVSGSQR